MLVGRFYLDARKDREHSDRNRCNPLTRQWWGVEGGKGKGLIDFPYVYSLSRNPDFHILC